MRHKTIDDTAKVSSKYNAAFRIVLPIEKEWRRLLEAERIVLAKLIRDQWCNFGGAASRLIF
jgi:hypothetical protein